MGLNFFRILRGFNCYGIKLFPNPGCKQRAKRSKERGLKQVTIGAVVGLSQARVSRILAQGL